MSMHYALSAIAVGAGGKTQRQMLDALCLKEMTQAEKE